MTLFVQKIFVDSDRHEFAMTQNARKDVVGIVTFDLVGFTSHQYIIILQWYSGFYDETFVVNIKKAQTTKIVELLLSECRIFWRNGKLRRLSGRFQTVISRPGDWRFKLWSLPDYLGQLTALHTIKRQRDRGAEKRRAHRFFPPSWLSRFLSRVARA